MTPLKTEPAKKRRIRDPKIVIDARHLDHIEALAEGAMQRNPTMADRLLHEIGRARVAPSKKMPKTVVSIGSIVTYRDETTGQERTVQLVYPEDADIARQRVSLMTPIGVALLGLAEGAAFYWDTRDDQRRTLTVIRVEQPADAEQSAG
ncbi:nucleoside diphosphate kinase regulator [Pikeienuella piscinae]|uniref:Nucleoside diphosphate kinase regulator n=1 Tax=Pikeienuella piscinae TaxID=2748098 RepID=A0A7L5BVD3_9RHOB|nr:nucleoside diphosphate kinase regulator [Pikeienuella piscinae]QIE54136.1 nucleoside diphosphate kinase regulator [Pikeienuella piscinae]